VRIKKDNRESVQKIRATIAQRLSSARQIFNLFGSSLSRSLGTIFFIPHPWIGIILWVALLQNPRYAAFAVLGFFVASCLDKVLKTGDTQLLGGGLKANALLAAVMVAWLTGATEIPLGAQLVMAVASAAAASILAAAVMRAVGGANLPSLVWGYCFIAAVLFNVCPTCTESAVSTMQVMPMPGDAIGWGMAFIRSLGTLIYAQSYEAGLLVGLAILLWSRILFVTGVVGWVSGVCITLAFEQLPVDYYWLPTSYNYFIAGMALGAVFFLPGWASLFMAALGGCIAAFLGLVLQHVLPESPIIYLPITAATSIWLVLITASFAGNNTVWRNYTPHLRPEDAWWYAKYRSQRLGHNEVLFSIPVAGELRISQGFNGSLSHAGDWCHALDFQRPTTIDNSPDPALNIWGGAVYSPASGYIERFITMIPDNQLGVCNYAENWGNYVIIRLDQGGWALLAHLQQSSIVLAIGTRVEAGDYLGNVGNSGRSPIPHLHLQAQSSPEPGSPTIPFRLVNYHSTLGTNTPCNHWNTAALPAEGEIVMAAYPNQMVHKVLASIAPGSAVWTIESQGHIPRNFRESHSNGIIRINTTLDEAGQHLFNSIFEEGTLVACLAADAWRIVETRQLTSSFMKLLAFVAPSIPYSARVGMTWRDPVPLMPTGPASWLSMPAAPYIGHHFISANCKCNSVPNVEGERLYIETTLDLSGDSSPLKLTCEFEILRGPVRIQADFKDGTVVYSLLSFEPGLPFDHSSAQ